MSRRFIPSLSLAAIFIAAATTLASAGDIASSPLVVQQVDGIRPVLATDGRVHLLYELLVINQSPFIVTIDKVAVVDAGRGTEIDVLSGEELAATTRLTMLGGDGTLLQPSQSSFVFLDATVSTDATPDSIISRLTVTQTAMEEGTGSYGGLTVTPEVSEATVTFDVAATEVSDIPAIELVAPVHGDNWIVFRGCCDLATSHRGGVNAYNGTLHVTERFGVDFVRMDETGLMITGPGDQLESYVHYGEPVYAVADGIIVRAVNDQPNQTPECSPTSFPKHSPAAMRSSSISAVRLPSMPICSPAALPSRQAIQFRQAT